MQQPDEETGRIQTHDTTDEYVNIVLLVGATCNGKLKHNLHFPHHFRWPGPATATGAMRGNTLFLLLFRVNH